MRAREFILSMMACCPALGSGCGLRFMADNQELLVAELATPSVLLMDYRFNGNLADSSQNRFADASLVGAALNPAEGSAGALCFSGSANHYGNLGDSYATRMISNQPKTFAIWFKVTDYALNANPNLLRYDDRDIQDGDNPNSRSTYIIRLNSSGRHYMYVGDVNQGLTAASSPAAQFPTGQWTHLVWVRDPEAQMIYGYQNGSLIVSQVDSTATQTWETTGQSLLLGRMNDGSGGTEPFRGCMDEVKIYSKALSADEVEAIFDDERAAFGI